MAVKDIVWSRVMSIGVDEVDEDHRRLVDLFNLLNHAVGEGEPLDYLAAILEELINCTVWHFSHEERLMLKHRYPETGEHKAEHRALIESARALQEKILQAGTRIEDEDLAFLEHWLAEHILTSDMRLGAQLSQVM
jgi:hemerythrin-like metal-binding protein